MDDLLKLAIEAHGGLERWRTLLRSKAGRSCKLLDNFLHVAFNVLWKA
jgi:hypothetical protein